MNNRCVIWAPPGEAVILSNRLKALLLYPGMTSREVIDCQEQFRADREAVLVISTGFSVVGYKLAPAVTFFLDGCPDDFAWVTQALSRHHSAERPEPPEEPTLWQRLSRICRGL